MPSKPQMMFYLFFSRFFFWHPARIFSEIPPLDVIAQEPDLIAESYYHVAKYESALEKRAEMEFHHFGY